jgi:hypothetical protein
MAFGTELSVRSVLFLPTNRHFWLRLCIECIRVLLRLDNNLRAEQLPPRSFPAAPTLQQQADLPHIHPPKRNRQLRPRPPHLRRPQLAMMMSLFGQESKSGLARVGTPVRPARQTLRIGSQDWRRVFWCTGRAVIRENRRRLLGTISSSVF